MNIFFHLASTVSSEKILQNAEYPDFFFSIECLTRFSLRGRRQSAQATQATHNAGKGAIVGESQQP
jgi:hypothetical protein